MKESLSIGELIASIPQVGIDIFFETQAFANSAKDASQHRHMHRATTSICPGGIDAAIDAYSDAHCPEVIIIEVQGSSSVILNKIDTLAQLCVAGTKVIIIGETNDILLYRELMQRGVSDYLVGPLEPVVLVKAISSTYTAPGAQPVGRVIAVIGSKGGVGASTVAHNLAWATSKRAGVGTVLVDFDVNFGTVGIDFGQDPPLTLADALHSKARLDPAVIESLLVKCRGNENLNLIAAPATLESTSDLSEDIVERMIGILRSSTAPVVILDVPHSWTSWTRRLLINSDEIIIVSSPTLTNLRNTKNIVDTLVPLRTHDTAPKLILNQVGAHKKTEISQSDFVKPLGIELIGEIPFNSELFHDAANKGQMIAEVRPNDKVTDVIERIAMKILGREEPAKKSSDFFSSLKSKFKIKGK